MPKDVKGLQINVQFEGEPRQELTYQVIVFEKDKRPLFQQPVKGNSFQLPFDAKEMEGKRIFLAPFDDQRKNDFPLDKLDAGAGYELNIPVRINPAEPLIVTKIPADIWQWWWFCKCHVKGHVFNLCGNEYQPVYKARVHICEVDPIIWYIRKLPDAEIIKLRDDILFKLKNWHLPDPPPDPIRIDPIRRIQPRNPIAIGRETLAAADQPNELTNDAPLTTRVDIELPKEKLASFYSNSPYLVRDYLITNVVYLYPFWCRLYPWFLRCDQVAEVETNQTGWFEADIRYFCFGDRPDLYFWVEYFINGAWTIVYNPGLRCHTRWNYQCNTEVNIYLNDPRIPCPVPQPDIGDKDVFVFSIGNNVSVTRVHQGGTMVGQTMTGTPFEEGSPFGGSIEPRVYFGKFLADAVDGGNNYFYKWSFRREGETNWRTILGDTFRHYVQITADGPIFPAYKIGPNNDTLYRILRYHLPAADGGNDLWVVDSRSDTASTKFQTMSLDLDNNDVIDNFQATDGVYEIKMELYKYAGGTATRVNWTAENIRLFVPLSSLNSPFGDITISPETDPAIVSQYEYREGTDLFGFRMKLFIDNNPAVLSLDDVNVVNADATTGVAGPCGFLAFKDRITSAVNFAFHASQENNFATFGFGITKGNGSTDVFSAGNRVGVASTPIIHNGTTTVGTINLVAGDYHVSLSPNTLLGSCDKAAFLQSASIHPLVQDGYGRLYHDSSLATAFALEHKP